LLLYKKQWHKILLLPQVQHLGNPVFTEHDKSTRPNPSVINGTNVLQASYSGSEVEGADLSAIGTVFIVPRSDEALDLNGHAVITTSNGEKGTYTLYSIGHAGADGTTKDNGAAFFHTNSSGKLAIGYYII
jgi:hypothetical protein